MGGKRKFGAIILASVIVISGVFLYLQKEPYSTELVLNSLWENYEVQSTQIGVTDPVITIDVYDKNDISEVEKFLKANLSKDDLKKYEIEVFSRWS
ncbi:hypothetical protein JSQ81_11380 [Sporosarcina sp. Marseille-Q4063]|uniref:hypothetical protein n=1 Tax=Sporosarcina sp. Marseille-Q4063 TaxID=2810514 RepID=UPI001BAEC30A|nr:hypothetical protein [Sporosarcina sp. Marseille-Q4063]QUW20463.1 hypothetical protein JSQ81_11380 [Sporosarcina sp. Marseille-Q4063]